MNPINLFKFLEKEKGRPLPVRLKFIYGLPLTPDDLDIKGDLFLYNIKITSIPRDFQVGGTLSLTLTNITSLPPGLKVKDNLYLRNTNITSLPPDLKVGRDIYLQDTPLAEKSEKQILAMVTTGYIKGRIFK
jgi:hypothetical protein